MYWYAPEQLYMLTVYQTCPSFMITTSAVGMLCFYISMDSIIISYMQWTATYIEMEILITEL